MDEPRGSTPVERRARHAIGVLDEQLPRVLGPVCGERLEIPVGRLREPAVAALAQAVELNDHRIAVRGEPADVVEVEPHLRPRAHVGGLRSLGCVERDRDPVAGRVVDELLLAEPAGEPEIFRFGELPVVDGLLLFGRELLLRGLLLVGALVERHELGVRLPTVAVHGGHAHVAVLVVVDGACERALVVLRDREAEQVLRVLAAHRVRGVVADEVREHVGERAKFELRVVGDNERPTGRRQDAAACVEVRRLVVIARELLDVERSGMATTSARRAARVDQGLVGRADPAGRVEPIEEVGDGLVGLAPQRVGVELRHLAPGEPRVEVGVAVLGLFDRILDEQRHALHVQDRLAHGLRGRARVLASLRGRRVGHRLGSGLAERRLVPEDRVDVVGDAVLLDRARVRDFDQPSVHEDRQQRFGEFFGVGVALLGERARFGVEQVGREFRGLRRADVRDELGDVDAQASEREAQTARAGERELDCLRVGRRRVAAFGRGQVGNGWGVRGRGRGLLGLRERRGSVEGVEDQALQLAALGRQLAAGRVQDLAVDQRAVAVPDDFSVTLADRRSPLAVRHPTRERDEVQHPRVLHLHLRVGDLPLPSTLLPLVQAPRQAHVVLGVLDRVGGPRARVLAEAFQKVAELDAVRRALDHLGRPLLVGDRIEQELLDFVGHVLSVGLVLAEQELGEVAEPHAGLVRAEADLRQTLVDLGVDDPVGLVEAVREFPVRAEPGHAVDSGRAAMRLLGEHRDVVVERVPEDLHARIGEPLRPQLHGLAGPNDLGATGLERVGQAREPPDAEVGVAGVVLGVDADLHLS